MAGITRAFSEALAAVIRRRREAKGMSLSKLSELAGIAQSYSGMLEKQERVPTVDVAHALAKALGCELSDLVLEAEKRMRRKGR